MSWRYTSKEERVQAKRGLGIYLSVGDVEAADWEVRKKSGRARGSALSTERKRQQRFERKKKKKKSSYRFAFSLMCVGLIAGL